MGQKDIIQKTLESYNDVFADIVNVLVFNGKNNVKESDLEDESPRSCLKLDEKLHEQERDVAKFWKNCNLRIALYGIENQINSDDDMPLRVISYDGASYKKQLVAKIKNNNRKERYPVITLVLYFGKGHWSKAKTLKERIAVPKELDALVNDYKANIFEISYLSEEQVKLFKSDFRIVADYFVQTRTKKDYIPSTETIRHVSEVLQLMRVLTGDDRFTPDVSSLKSKGKSVTMCEVLDKVENRGIQKGIQKGIKKGIKEGEKKGRIKTLYELAKDGILTLKQAAERMEMTESKFKAAVKEL